MSPLLGWRWGDWGPGKKLYPQYLGVSTKLTGLSFLSVFRRIQLSHWQVPRDWMEGAYCSDMGSGVPVCHAGDLRKTVELLFPYFVSYSLCWESFSRDAIAKYHKFGGWKQQKWIFSQCWKGEVRGPCVGWADPFWMFWGTIPFPPLIWFLMDAVTRWPPWLVAADLQSSPPSPHDSLPVFPGPNFLLLMTPVISLTPTHIWYELILAWWHWQKPYFQINSQSQVLAVRNEAYFYGTEFSP